ncbi:hypothetical protein L3X38_018039 [Prunus dulcis]|uniref:Uncharacterized protein n=1 Tax=Prunus dulcis TaxID=3755 RepID=A0AAD4Z9Q4_PRUDU|nr:hypothetical protein L3X38_018039 [Prunus dulcis]
MPGENYQAISSANVLQQPHADIATFVATAEPQSFDALVSKASNVERQIAHQKSATQKIQFGEKKNDKKSAKGESLATFVKTEKKSDKGQSKDPPKMLILKERKEVKYSFDDEDVEEIFDQRLASNGITLPESKRPAEAKRQITLGIAGIIASPVIRSRIVIS